MRATGSKLIKVAEAYGHDILQDVETDNFVIFIEDQPFTSKDIEELFMRAAEHEVPADSEEFDR